MVKILRRQSLYIEFKKHNKRIQILIIYLLVSLVCNMLCKDINHISESIGSPNNIFDGFLMLNNGLYTQLALTIGLLLINSNTPFMNDDQYFVLIRTGKCKWLINRIGLSITNVLVYCATVLIFTVIFTMKDSYFGNFWSILVRGSATGLNSILALGPPVVFNISMLNNISVYGAVLHSFLLVSLYWILLSMLMLVINLTSKKNIGFVVALIIHFIGWIVVFMNTSPLEYVSPMNNSMLVYHSFGTSLDPTLIYSYIYFLLIIGGLMFLSRRMIRKYNFY